MQRSTLKKKMSTSEPNWSESWTKKELFRWRSTNTKKWPSSMNLLLKPTNKTKGNTLFIRMKTANFCPTLTKGSKPINPRKASKRRGKHRFCSFKALKRSKRRYLNKKRSPIYSQKSALIFIQPTNLNLEQKISLTVSKSSSLKMCLRNWKQTFSKSSASDNR